MKLEFTPMAAGYVTVAIEGPEASVLDTVDDFLMSTDFRLLSTVSREDVCDPDDCITRATFLLQVVGGSRTSGAAVTEDSVNIS